MVEPPRRRQSTREITAGALRDVVRIPGILRLTAYSVGVFALLRMAMVMFFNPALKQVGVPVHTFGAIFALVNIFGAVAAWRAHRWLERLGERALLVAMPVALVAMFALLMALRTPLAATLFCIQGVSFAIYPLLMRTILNRLVPTPARRATILSIESLLCRLAFGPISVFAGWAMGALSLNAAIGLSVLIACLPFTVVPWLPRARAPDV
jgi:predicted MFS family arabinose efflux permease